MKTTRPFEHHARVAIDGNIAEHDVIRCDSVLDARTVDGGQPRGFALVAEPPPRKRSAKTLWQREPPPMQSARATTGNLSAEWKGFSCLWKAATEGNPSSRENLPIDPMTVEDHSSVPGPRRKSQ